MKFSFSTLACPGYTWADIYSMAKDLGFDGIEVRGWATTFLTRRRTCPFPRGCCRDQAEAGLAATDNPLPVLGLLPARRRDR